MAIRRVLIFAIVSFAAARADAQPVSEAERREGFISLFNGKDFTGWRFSGGKGDAAEQPKNWSVAEGVIRLSGGGSPHLASQWDYEDFDMRMQWKAQKKGYNSGFYVRSGRNVGANQINLAESDCGHLMGGAKGGNKVPELQKAAGEWNDWRVLAVGDKLTFWCNGQKAWEVTGFKPARGYLGLQAEGAAIDFRNLRIKELGYETVDLRKMKFLSTDDGSFPLITGDYPLMTKAPAGDYTLRTEIRLPKGTSARLLLRGKDGKVDLAAKSLQEALNPAGQWNYLEVRVEKNKAKVWLNGMTPKEAIDLGDGDAVPLTLESVGAPVENPISVRAVRIRRDAK